MDSSEGEDHSPLLSEINHRLWRATPMPAAAIFRPVVTSLVAVALALTAAACTKDRPVEEPSAAPSASPSPATPRGAELSAEQQADYEKALARWTEYTVRSEPIWATGKFTPEAVELFQEYWVPYPLMVDRLETYERSGISVSGVVEVIESWPVKVTSKNRIVTVVLKQCVDPSPIVISPTPQGEIADPYIRTVTLDRTKTRQFKVLSVKDLGNTKKKKVQRCGS